jgi:hypothetical protein
MNKTGNREGGFFEKKKNSSFSGASKSGVKKTFGRATESSKNNKQYVGVRIEPLSYAKLAKAVSHDLRFQKPKSWSENEQNTVWIRTNERTLEKGVFTLKNKKIRKLGEDLLGRFEADQNKHSNLYYAESKRKGKPQSLNKNRVCSKAEGILYFSESINDLARSNRPEFEAKVYQTIEAIVKKHNSSLDMISIHFDEYKPLVDTETKEVVLDDEGNTMMVGNVHAHFIMNNYDQQGQVLGYANTSEVGGELQTLAYEHWKDWGFNRGEKKSEIKRQHMTPHEYAEFKDTQRKVKKLTSEVELQTKKLEKVWSLKQRVEENLDDVLQEFKEVVLQMAQLEAEMSAGQHRGVGSLIQRAVGYGEDGKSDKFKKLVNTVKGKYIKMERKYARQNNKKADTSGASKNTI